MNTPLQDALRELKQQAEEIPDVSTSSPWLKSVKRHGEIAATKIVEFAQLAGIPWSHMKPTQPPEPEIEPEVEGDPPFAPPFDPLDSVPEELLELSKMQMRTPLIVDGYSVLEAIDFRREFWTGRDSLPPEIHCYLPHGSFPGMAFGAGGWYDVPKVDLDWLGNSRLVLVAHPEGTQLIPGHENTLVVRSTPKWKGAITFAGIDIVAGKANLVDGGHYGALSRKPTGPIVFTGGSWSSGPLTCNRPGSFTQCQVLLRGIKVRLRDSHEHLFYDRHGYGPTLMMNLDVDGVGGHLYFNPERTHEGPELPPSNVYIVNNTFRNYQAEEDPNFIRGGCAIEIAGAGRDYLIAGNLLEDLEREVTYGVLVAYDGGSHYPLPSGYANGRIRVRDNTFRHTRCNRDIISIKDAERFEYLRNDCVSENGIPRPIRVYPKFSNAKGVRSGLVEGNHGNVPVVVKGGRYKYDARVEW